MIFASADEGSADSSRETPMNRWNRCSEFGLDGVLLVSDPEDALPGKSFRSTEDLALDWNGFHHPAETTSGEGAADNSWDGAA